MFKRLALLFLSIFMMSSVASNASLFEGCSHPIYAEESEEKPNIDGYTYVETYKDGPTRTFDDRNIGPQLNRLFCAPAGYVFTLDLPEETIYRCLEIYEHSGFNYSFAIFRIYYETFGTSVRVNEFGPYFFDDSLPSETNRGYLAEVMQTSIDGSVMLEMENVVVETELTLAFECVFMAKIGPSESDFVNYNYIFRSQPIKSEPFGEEDLLFTTVHHFENNNTQKRTMVVNVLPIDGFFYEYPLYNEYGYHSKTSHSIYVSEDGDIVTVPKADYKITLFAYDSVSLGVLDEMGLSLTYPPEPIPVRARLEFIDEDDVRHVFFTKQFILQDPNFHIAVDDENNRNSIQRNTTHLFSITLDNYVPEGIYSYNAEVMAKPYRLSDSTYGVDLYDKKLPEKGQKGMYYYIPSDQEIELHKQGKDEQLKDTKAEGIYYIWDESSSTFIEYDGEQLIRSFYNTEDDGPDYDIDALSSAIKSLPFVGMWRLETAFASYCRADSYYIEIAYQFLEVVDPNATEDAIILNVPDTIHLIAGAGEIEIVPTITSFSLDVTYYYDYEVSKTGVVDITEEENGKLLISPHNVGLINLTITCESAVFATLTKTISIRVLDSIYDVATIEVPDEFHFTGKDLMCAVNIRGFTNFQNLDVDWEVTDSDGKEIEKDKIQKNNDATMVLKEPKTEDYTIKASYEGIELDKIKVQVRKVDMNHFLRMNIWWIFLITMALVALMLFIQSLTKKGKTTVEHIGRVYDVYCQCVSDDRLTKNELERIKKEITRCLRRCEDLNIEALNQYEKSIRYLRKSLMDSKLLLKKWDELSIDDKSAYTEQLNHDLSKALNVAKEIENAKSVSESYYQKANIRNFEVLEDENTPKNNKKKDK